MNNVVYIQLTQDKVAVVDQLDFSEVSKYSWHFDKHTGYARRSTMTKNRKNIKQRLHELILGKPPQGTVTDHTNQNKLDNRRSNLRFVSRSENLRNNNRIKGYSYSKTHKKWKATISINNKSVFIGYFNSSTEARKAYLTYKGNI